MFLPFYLSSRRSLKQGFSLIEMLVVLTIFIIMLGVVLANFPAFRDKTALQLIAQEIATTIRQAQVYGIGTRAAGTGTAFQSYGLYFDVGFGADKKSFILFSDSDIADKEYGGDLNCFPGSECVEKFTIRGGAEIDDIKGCNISGCDLTVPLSFTILFQRFYPEAGFFDSGTPISGGISYARIIVKSTRNQDDKRCIDVWNTGQISVKIYDPAALTCP